MYERTSKSTTVESEVLSLMIIDEDPYAMFCKSDEIVEM